MRALFFCAVLVVLQGCATRPVACSRQDNNDVVWGMSEVEHRLSEIELLNQGQSEKTKRLMEMDINALLVVLSEYDKTGDLHDEAKDSFERAKAYRKEHPFKVSKQDEIDFPGSVFNADEIIQEIIKN